MTHRSVNRRRFVANAAMVVLALLVFAMSATQNVVACALDEFAEITERALHFPCTLLDHGKCFTLDRFDPTCPQCL
jgi:hypothetical protein